MLFAFLRQNNIRRATSVLRLYMTDMNRFYPIGPLFADGVFKNADTLQYMGGEVFALYEWNAGQGRVVLAHLTEQLDEINTALRNWDAVDKKVTTPCTSTSKEGTASDGACSTPTPADGLVGYLSNEGERDCWVNEYLAASATVVGTATKVEGGATFEGPGVWAEWPVGNRWRDQRFHIVKKKFTLLVTVTIGTAPAGSGSALMVAVGGAGSVRMVGLSVTAENKREATFDGEAGEVQHGNCGLKRTYRVAFVLHNGMGTVCVGGKTLGSSATTVTRGAQLLDVSCFYVGGDGCGGSGSSQVTLTHFCLCNRPLTGQELQMPLLRGKQTEAGCKEGKATLRPGNFAAKLPQDPGVDAAAGEMLPVPAKGEFGAGNSTTDVNGSTVLLFPK
ncbi:trans-sialidase [Trypanosoma cruzi]|uniref:Trans-sialidase, putative n=1 Tax=Trypanosoma cruzi (strain CL Brener) TaxID=353153 RepID=Q4DVY1_TRYCC|nr:trans-sialidase, putative [Trypanosoma cruzi]EAN96668.1 trans-sialidase, putative [Trypanosoma cruzi]RNC53061.1 trans-sialidase [Trypanosoma cruzi]|eukprot:XP_818519.1 trans-sialidase [Trypanosoma cruzi strain CL Brener]